MKRENIAKVAEIADQLRNLDRDYNRLQSSNGICLVRDSSVVPITERGLDAIRKIALGDIEREITRLLAELEAL